MRYIGLVLLLNLYLILLGLGTSTSKEAKEYFTDMAKHKIPFKYRGTEDDASINLVSMIKAHVLSPKYKNVISQNTCTVEAKYFIWNERIRLII